MNSCIQIHHTDSDSNHATFAELKPASLCKLAIRTTVLSAFLAFPGVANAGDFIVVGASYSGANVVFSATCDRAAWWNGTNTGRLWTRGVPGITSLVGVPTFATTYVGGISADGSTVTGWTYDGTNDRPGYWRDFSAPRVNLPFNTSLFRGGRTDGASTNGNVIVGSLDPISGNEPRTVVWRLSPSATTIINPLSGGTRCFPSGVSGDGLVVVGDSAVFQGGQDVHTAFVYRASSNPTTQSLPPLPGSNDSRAYGLSRDGQWAYGSCNSTGFNMHRGTLWNTLTRAPLAVPNFYPGENFSPLGISADGSVLGGNTFNANHTDVTVVLWRRDTGQMYEINELAASLGIDMGGWTMNYMLAVSDDGRTFAGTVTRTINGTTFNETGILRIDCFDGPVITSQPIADSDCRAASASVNASGPGQIGYQWQVEDASAPGNWLNLMDGILFIGGQPIADVDGAYTGGVTLAAVDGMHRVYRVRCHVTNTCGGLTSDVVSLSTCPGDFNCDGAIGSQDYFDFLAAFFAGTGDFNHDGGANSQDFFDFLAAFFSGC